MFPLKFFLTPTYLPILRNILIFLFIALKYRFGMFISCLHFSWEKSWKCYFFGLNSLPDLFRCSFNHYVFIFRILLTITLYYTFITHQKWESTTCRVVITEPWWHLCNHQRCMYRKIQIYLMIDHCLTSL